MQANAHISTNAPLLAATKERTNGLSANGREIFYKRQNRHRWRQVAPKKCLLAHQGV
jgi:hypothetical protein